MNLRGLVLLLLIGQLGFTLSVDYASFRYAKNFNLVELYYSVPYRDLIYQTINETIFADVRIDYSIHNSFSSDSVIDSALHRLTLTSFKEAEAHDLVMVDQRNFYARPGRYWLNFTVSCLTQTEPVKIGFYSDTFEIKDYSDSLCLSDIEFAAQISKDTTTEGKFNKDGLLVIPNPSGEFGLAYNLINVYLEVYNMVPDTCPFEFTYAILNSQRTPLKTFGPERRRKEGASVSLTFAISTKGLDPGSYFLFIRLRDLSTAKEVTKAKLFSIAEPIKTLASFRPVSPADQHYYEMIQFFATENELRQFKKLTGIARDKFLERFWAKHNFQEFLTRIKYADSRFALGRKPGSETDRGRIYIKYGAPDEIEDLPMTDYSHPQQKWRYYQKELIFIFIDLYGNGNLQLIYSNAPTEKNHPDWKKYINLEEIKE